MLYGVKTYLQFFVVFSKGNNFCLPVCVPEGGSATKMESTIKRKSLL